MIQRLCRVLLFAFTSTTAAHAAGKHEPWRAVERLKPGSYVVVRGGQQAFEDCTLISVDDSTLTCRRERDPNANWDAASDARLIFPRASIAVVWLIETAQERHIGRWIALGVSAALVIAASVTGGTFGAAIMGGIVAIAWTAWLENPIRSLPSPQPQTRRRLIYRSAAP